MDIDKRMEELLEARGPLVLPRNYITVTVELKPSELFEEVSKVYEAEAERVMRFTVNQNFVVTKNDFLKYFKTLLYLRVTKATGVKNNTTAAYHSDMRSYQVPAFIHILLTSIGVATDRDFGFVFVPAVKGITDQDLLSPEEMREISLKLSRLSIEGLTCVDTGISMRPECELSFMAVLNIEGEILSYKKDHPLYGFYAAFFKHQIIDETLNPSALRIRYGSQKEYEAYVLRVV